MNNIKYLKKYKYLFIFFVLSIIFISPIIHIKYFKNNNNISSDFEEVVIEDYIDPYNEYINNIPYKSEKLDDDNYKEDLPIIEYIVSDIVEDTNKELKKQRELAKANKYDDLVEDIIDEEDIIISSNDIANYMIKPKENKKVKKFLEKESQKYKIEKLNSKISKEIIQSAILYVYLTENKKYALFKEYNKEKRIKIVAKTLATIGYLETRGENFNFSAMSATQAFGRYQINGTTLAEMIIQAKIIYGIDIENIDISSYKGKYPYHKIKALLKEYEIKSNKIYNSKWDNIYKEKQLKDILIFSKRFNNSLNTYSNSLYSYISHRYKKDLKNFIDTQLKNNNKYSAEKMYNVAIKTLKLFKEPINQGVFAAIVFENKMKRIKNLKNKSLNFVISETLKYYNADHNNRVKYNGKYISIAEKYSITGKNVFQNRYLVVNN